MSLVSIIFLEIHYFIRLQCGEGWEERGKMQVDLHEILDVTESLYKGNFHTSKNRYLFKRSNSSSFLLSLSGLKL